MIWKPQKAFSLLELLLVVMIVAVLTSLGVMSYMGAMYAADLRATLPSIMKRFEDFQKIAQDDYVTIEVEFIEGASRIRVTRRGGGGSQTIEKDLKDDSFLKRHPVFGDYRWPDGAKMPRTFTFFPHMAPQGGEVQFGSAFASARIFLRGGKAEWDL